MVIAECKGEIPPQDTARCPVHGPQMGNTMSPFRPAHHHEEPAPGPVRQHLVFALRIVVLEIGTLALGFVVVFLFLREPLAESYGAAFEALRTAYRQVYVYVGVAVLLQLASSMALVYFLSLYYSHRIAGPMYKLKIILRQYLEGNPVTRITFRRSDLVHAMATWFTEFLLFLEHRRKLLEEAETLCDSLTREGRRVEGSREAERIQEIIAKLENPGQI